MLRAEAEKATIKAKDLSSGMAAMLADLGADIAAVKSLQVRLPSSLSSSSNASLLSTPSTSPTASLDTVPEAEPSTSSVQTPIVHPKPTPTPNVPNNTVESKAINNKRKLNTPIVQQNVLNQKPPPAIVQKDLIADFFKGHLNRKGSVQDPKKAQLKSTALPHRPHKIFVRAPEAYGPPAPIIPVHQPPPIIASNRDTENIDRLVDFIEGKRKPGIKKKAAKKAKQKQKKMDDKKVEELEQIRNEFHDVFFKESAAKKDLKSMKGTHKKDKKRLSDTENFIKKMGKTRSKLEATILELIAELKKNNSEFKFSYLPTKEQQLEKQAMVNTKSSPVVAAPNLCKEKEEETPPPCSEPMLRPGSSTHTVTSPGCEMITDYAKQMVTIRRVNTPHSDPQVTVTAKGPSPDSDKLLYTFINGQIMPGK